MRGHRKGTLDGRVWRYIVPHVAVASRLAGVSKIEYVLLGELAGLAKFRSALARTARQLRRARRGEEPT